MYFNFGGILSVSFFSIFYCKISNAFIPSRSNIHSICHILGTVGAIVVKQKDMSQLNTTLNRLPLTLTFELDIWPWISMVKLYLGDGSPDCHGTKRTGVDRMPWCETQPLCDLDSSSCCNIPSWMTEARVSYRDNCMAADGLMIKRV